MKKNIFTFSILSIISLIVIAFIVMYYNSYQEYFDNKELSDIKKTFNNALAKPAENIMGSVVDNILTNVKGYLNTFAARFGSSFNAGGVGVGGGESFKTGGNDCDQDSNQDQDQDQDLDQDSASSSTTCRRKTPININIKIPRPHYQPSRPSTSAMQLQSGNECPYCNAMPCQCGGNTCSNCNSTPCQCNQSSLYNLLDSSSGNTCSTCNTNPCQCGSSSSTTSRIQTLGRASTSLGSSETQPSAIGSAPYCHPNAYSYINQLPTPQNPMISPIEPSEPNSIEMLTNNSDNEYQTFNPSRNPANMASEYNETISPEMYKDPKYMKFLKMVGHVPINELGTVCPSLYNDTLQGRKNSDTLLNERIARAPPRVDHSERTNIYKNDQIKAPKIFTLLNSQQSDPSYQQQHQSNC